MVSGFGVVSTEMATIFTNDSVARWFIYEVQLYIVVLGTWQGHRATYCELRYEHVVYRGGDFFNILASLYTAGGLGGRTDGKHN